MASVRGSSSSERPMSEGKDRSKGIIISFNWERTQVFQGLSSGSELNRADLSPLSLA